MKQAADEGHQLLLQLYACLAVLYLASLMCKRLQHNPDMKDSAIAVYFSVKKGCLIAISFNRECKQVDLLSQTLQI
jgi:hypothetical protein